jgi:hypothetical protein
MGALRLRDASSGRKIERHHGWLHEYIFLTARSFVKLEGKQTEWRQKEIRSGTPRFEHGSFAEHKPPLLQSEVYLRRPRAAEPRPSTVKH